MAKLLLVAAVCTAAALFVAASPTAALPPKDFDAWCAHYLVINARAAFSHLFAIRVAHHGKTYPSAAARHARRVTFEHNLNFVAFLNAEDPTATFAMTQVIVLSSHPASLTAPRLAVCRFDAGGVPLLAPYARCGACCSQGHSQHRSPHPQPLFDIKV
jgi:hypothetical protein